MLNLYKISNTYNMFLDFLKIQRKSYYVAFFSKFMDVSLKSTFVLKNEKASRNSSFFHKKKALRIEKITKNTLLVDLLTTISFGSRLIDTSCKSESSNTKLGHIRLTQYLVVRQDVDVKGEIKNTLLPWPFVQAGYTAVSYTHLTLPTIYSV